MPAERARRLPRIPQPPAVERRRLDMQLPVDLLEQAKADVAARKLRGEADATVTATVETALRRYLERVPG